MTAKPDYVEIKEEQRQVRKYVRNKKVRGKLKEQREITNLKHKTIKKNNLNDQNVRHDTSLTH